MNVTSSGFIMAKPLRGGYWRIFSGICVILMMHMAFSVWPNATCGSESDILVVRITVDNCPVYSEPTMRDEEIIHTLQLGGDFALLEERAPFYYDKPFYRIRYGDAEQSGWVYGGNVEVRHPSDLKIEIPEKGRAVNITGAQNVAVRIKELVRHYNEAHTQEAAAYELRPFPVFRAAFHNEELDRFLTGDGTLTVPLIYSSAERRLRLCRLDKGLFQLIMKNCFGDAKLRLNRVVIEIHFGEESGTPVRLGCSYADWKSVVAEKGGPKTFWKTIKVLEEFWEITVGDEKDLLWSGG